MVVLKWTKATKLVMLSVMCSLVMHACYFFQKILYVCVSCAQCVMFTSLYNNGIIVVNVHACNCHRFNNFQELYIYM